MGVSFQKAEEKAEDLLDLSKDTVHFREKKERRTKMDLETPITTQEQLDTIVGEKANEMVKGRLAREAKKFEGYTSPDDLAKLKGDYDKQITDLNAALTAAAEKQKGHDKEIADRDAKIRAYETDSLKTRIAHENGLPYDSIKFLQGEDEDSIKASAESLKALVGNNRQTPPGASPEKPVNQTDAKAAAYKKLLSDINNK